MPLCRGHHRELHRQGNEAVWWSNASIDPLMHARLLWQTTHTATTVHSAIPSTPVPQGKKINPVPKQNGAVNDSTERIILRRVSVRLDAADTNLRAYVQGKSWRVIFVENARSITVRITS